MEPSEFPEFLARVRTGDPAAVAAVIARYEPYLHRVIRIRIQNQRLRHACDTADVWQTVMKDFFEAVADGRFDLHSHAQLRALLVTMTLNRVRDIARKEARHGLLPTGWDTPDPNHLPEQVLADAELVDLIRSRLGDEDARLFDQKRGDGRSWEELASQTGESVAAVRMRLTRSVRRVRALLAGSGDRHDPDPGPT
jgi:RNA polymerase sigma factor (sigma-70 family)